MAEGLAKHLMPTFEFSSAGISPESYVSPYSVRVMEQRNIDISKHTPRHIDAFLDDSISMIVCFGKKAYDYCLQNFDNTHIMFYDITDPWGSVGTDEQIIEIYNNTCKAIEKIIESICLKY